MYKVPIKYDEYKPFIRNEQELDIFFNEIKELMWMKFCNQIRDFSFLIFNLLKNKKYSKIKEYIEKTNFLYTFLLDYKKYNALSLTLHNFNKHLYGTKKFEESFTVYEKFDEVISAHKNKLNDVKLEFEKIIFLFRKEDEYDTCRTYLCLNNWSKIFGMLDYLVMNKKL